MQEAFDRLVKDLGKTLHISLHSDDKQCCTFLIDETLMVQLEKDKHAKGYLLGTMIAFLPPGKFREEILKNALQSNHFYPRMGTFGYSAYNNQLALYYFVEDPDISAEKLLDIMSSFVGKAFEWKQAIEQNQSAPSQFFSESSDKSSPPFPLKP